MTNKEMKLKIYGKVASSSEPEATLYGIVYGLGLAEYSNAEIEHFLGEFVEFIGTNKNISAIRQWGEKYNWEDKF